jgi:hypothetical protein
MGVVLGQLRRFPTRCEKLPKAEDRSEHVSTGESGETADWTLCIAQTSKPHAFRIRVFVPIQSVEGVSLVRSIA